MPLAAGWRADLTSLIESQTPPQSGWLDELGRLKGGRQLPDAIGVIRALSRSWPRRTQNRADQSFLPTPALYERRCEVSGHGCVGPNLLRAFSSQTWGCLDGQTSSSRTGRTRGLPNVQLELEPDVDLNGPWVTGSRVASK
jgi:hypothetical protein